MSNDTRFDFATVAGWLAYVEEQRWSPVQTLENLRDHQAMTKKMILELMNNGRPYDDLLDHLRGLKLTLDYLTAEPTTRAFTTSKGELVESDLTDQDAIALLGRCRSNFAQSLHSQHVSGRRLTTNQWPWVHKLALEQRARENPAPVSSESSLNLSEVVAMLTQAAGHLQWPIIAVNTDDGEVRFKFARGGKIPGSVNVVNHSTRQYLGRIMLDGTFVAAPAYTFGDYAPLLGDLAEDAKGVLAAAGRMSTKCCFCRRDLVTDESVAVGYGPVCADRYGLPWG